MKDEKLFFGGEIFISINQEMLRKGHVPFHPAFLTPFQFAFQLTVFLFNETKRGEFMKHATDSPHYYAHIFLSRKSFSFFMPRKMLSTPHRREKILRRRSKFRNSNYKAKDFMFLAFREHRSSQTMSSIEIRRLSLEIFIARVFLSLQLHHFHFILNVTRISSVAFAATFHLAAFIDTFIDILHNSLCTFVYLPFCK